VLWVDWQAEMCFSCSGTTDTTPKTLYCLFLVDLTVPVSTQEASGGYGKQTANCEQTQFPAYLHRSPQTFPARVIFISVAKSNLCDPGLGMGLMRE
ncbi:hypothetical protein GOODEAATRI_018860, partial [Goodea atripinnis]